MFAFDSFFNQGPNANTVQIFQTQPLSTTPLVNCITLMLTVCGDFTASYAHPSGQYVFLRDINYLTDILQVDLTTQQLTQINTLPGNVEKLSPDGSVIYGDNPNNAEIRIAGFNATNGEVKLGGSILLPHVIDDYWTPAERY
jgi:Tol biopolymer transport system component